MSELLTCEGLTKSYQKGTNALDSIDLHIGFGRIVGLLEALVGGAVVHHDEFEILFGLGVDRLDGVFEPAFAVDVGDDDGRFHSFLCSCAFSCSIQEIV